MGATVDLSILNFVLNASAAGDAAPEFVMEVTDKTRADVKGGTLIQVRYRGYGSYRLVGYCRYCMAVEPER